MATKNFYDLDQKNLLNDNPYFHIFYDKYEGPDLKIKKEVIFEALKSYLGNDFQDIYDLINEKVDKVDGKQLSTEDFTNELLIKLNSIEENANVNNISNENALLLVNGEDNSLHYHSSDRNWNNLTNKPSPEIILKLVGAITGDGIITLNDLESGLGSILTSISNNSVVLGEHTSGEYVKSLTSNSSFLQIDGNNDLTIELNSSFASDPSTIVERDIDGKIEAKSLLLSDSEDNIGEISLDAQNSSISFLLNGEKFLIGGQSNTISALNTGDIIQKGRVVKINKYQNGNLTTELLTTENYNINDTIAYCNQIVNSGDTASFILFGEVNNANVDGVDFLETWSYGDKIYLKDQFGNLSNTIGSNENILKIGQILNPSNTGSIFIEFNNLYNLNNLNNVSISNQNSGDILYYNNGWVNINENNLNVNSAQKLLNPIKISFIGDVSGEATFDGSENFSANIAVIDGSHNHNISDITGLQDKINTYDAHLIANNPHNITAETVGLENVDNTSDLNKPLSSATILALSNKVDKIDGKQLSTEDYTTAEKNKLALLNTGDFVTSVNGETGSVILTKDSLGLGNVDNTSDLDKPISNATQLILDNKADLDENGTVPLSQMNPSIFGKMEYISTWDAYTNTPELENTPLVKGSYYVVSASGEFNSIEYNVGDWIVSNGLIWEKIDNTDSVVSVNGKNGIVELSTDDIINLPQHINSYNAHGATSDDVSGRIVLRDENGSFAISAIKFSLNNPQVLTSETGLIQWNPDDETIDIGLSNGVVHQVGAEITPQGMNQTGFDIPNGKLVMYAGEIGNSGKVKIKLAITDGSYHPLYILGLTTENIPNGETGKVTFFGNVRGFNTTGSDYGEIWNNGDVIYANPNIEGGLTNVKPVASNLYIVIGIVISASANGTIFVNMNNGYRLSDLHDVNINNLQDEQFIRYNLNNSRWENYTISKNDVGLNNVDNTSDINKPISTATSSALALKVDVVAGYGLSKNDFTDALLSKLNGIESGATVNSSDAYLLSRSNHTGTQAISTVEGLQTALNSKLDATANAVSASKLADARTISLAGDVSGSTSFDGSANVSITATVADDSHNHSHIESLGNLSAETGRDAHSSGVYTYNVTNASLGYPTPAAYYSILSFGRGSTSGRVEIAASWVGLGNELWFRSLRDTTYNWYLWSKIYHSGNDGAGSGLDADKLDNQHGSYYLDRTNHTGTQAISTVSGLSESLDLKPSIYGLPNVIVNNTWIYLGELTIPQEGYSVQFKLVGNLGYNASNTQNSEVNLRFKTSNSISNQNGFYGDAQFYSIGQNIGFCKQVRIVQISTTVYRFYVLTGPATGDGSFYVVNKAYGSWSNSGTNYGTTAPTGTYIDATEYKVWSEYNDGAGSGLDADLLDGAQSAVNPTASTVPVRDSSGDMYARLFGSTYGNNSSINSSAAVCMRVNNTTDNYIRSVSPAAYVTWFNAQSNTNAKKASGLSFVVSSSAPTVNDQTVITFQT